MEKDNWTSAFREYARENLPQRIFRWTMYNTYEIFVDEKKKEWRIEVMRDGFWEEGFDWMFSDLDEEVYEAMKKWFNIQKIKEETEWL